MKVFETVDTFIDVRKALSNDLSVGLIPTMGNLHDGHLSLVKESQKHHDINIVTIFVNPLQFGPNEDFDNYPRTLKEDLRKLELVDRKEGEIWVLAPTDSMFPKGFNSLIRVNQNQSILCGIDRPGHFDGVTTVVYQLFQITKPHESFFGKKDFQQLWILKKMAKDLRLDIKITGLPIIRNKEGLALSSRNQYLSESQKNDALIIKATLNLIAKEIRSQNGFSNTIQCFIEEKKRQNEFIYLESRNPHTLELSKSNDKEFIIFGSKKIGQSRLIDNLEVSLI